MTTIALRAWQRWTSIREQDGWRGASMWLFNRVGERLVNLGISEVVWLELPDIKLVGAPPEGFEYRFLSPDELATFVSPENELSEHHVERARRGHDLCFAAVQNGRLAAFGWYALGCIEAIHCDNVPLSFPADVSYMYKGFTHPDFRGQRLHGYVMRLALEELARTRGVNKLVSTVSWINWPSLKSCDRLGYRRLGRMVKLGWGVGSFGFYPRAAKKLGIRFGRRADMHTRD